MKTEPVRSVYEQAGDYVNRVGVDEAAKSPHYYIGTRMCRCGSCFCCYVVDVVKNLKKPENKT